MVNVFKEEMKDKLDGLDKYMEQQEQKIFHGDVHNDEYADIQDKLNQLNNSNTLDEIKRIELVKASIIFEMLRSIDQLTESIQELNQDSNC